ncbi:intersectin-EH binding protein Ibp1 [Mycolicibacterium komossense]|uniref:Intersectin-EH binding protein Ibp1 n=1 Tax=Mycolicibacterium komossense TaxID=1779 RepID=A0ABT3CN56_9MYCO|nr:intersectin-EH binding protein Ibp1 [Mycolicibacterium komossense]MCV7230787.1 intersectin-EH binding protein Ibp1 [Mycolicibacterium komossense]
MAALSSPARRLLLAGGFAVTIAAAPAAALFSTPTAGPSTPVAACPSGETEDLYTDICTPEMSPNQPGGVSYSTPGDSNSVPELAGIPCTGHDTGKCIGLSQEQSPYVAPQSSLSSSP